MLRAPSEELGRQVSHKGRAQSPRQGRMLGGWWGVWLGAESPPWVTSAAMPRPCHASGCSRHVRPGRRGAETMLGWPHTERTQPETGCCLRVTQMAWDALPACFPEVPGCGERGGGESWLTVALKTTLPYVVLLHVSTVRTVPTRRLMLLQGRMIQRAVLRRGDSCCCRKMT